MKIDAKCTSKGHLLKIFKGTFITEMIATEKYLIDDCLETRKNILDQLTLLELYELLKSDTARGGFGERLKNTTFEEFTKSNEFKK